MTEIGAGRVAKPPVGRLRIIIDCDPGADDAVALMLAFASPEELEIVGITVAAGNVPVRLTQKNALMLCEFAGRAETPVYAGCDRPIMRLAHHAEVHGRTGIDGFPGFEPRARPQEKHAVDFLIDTLMAAEDGAITMVCIAPMTNLAVALIKEPRIAPKIARIVLMGGARSAGGNITPSATFNLYFDPHAAHVVFGCGRPLIAVSLDACSQVLCGQARLAALRSRANKVASVMADLIGHYDAVRIKKFGFVTDGAPMNDPCVIGYLLDSTLFTARKVNVEIDVQSELTMGMSVVDFWGITGRQPNALWVDGVDVDRFFTLLIDRLGRL